MSDQCATEKIREAQKLRDLGFYTRALESYREAENEKSDLMLATEISATMVEQGCVSSGFEKINLAIETFSETTEDKMTLAVAEMLRASTMATITVKFSSFLEVAAQLYNDHLLDCPVEHYEKRLVAMQAVYMNARAMASIVGTDLEGPSPDQEFLKQLFYHLVQDSRFAEASRVACIYSARAEPSQKIELIAYLLQEKLVPDLVRAEALYEYADLLQEANQVKQSDAQLEDAEKLYKKVGHAYGVLMIEMRRCTRQASRKSTTQVTERLYQIKQQLESIGYWEGARQAIKALYEIAQVSLDNELKNELDRELLRLRDIRGCPLDWVSQQLVTLATWDFSGANSAKMLSSLEALYESLNGMEAPRLRETTAYILSEKYKGLGEISKSAEWARINPEAYPNRWRFVYGADQFYKQLEETTEPADPDIEYEMLRTELARCAEDISAVTTPIGERYLGVMKVSSMCNFYLNQFQLRGFERTKSLVETCLEFAEARLDNLPPAGSKLWKGNLFEIRARLKFIEAHIEQPPNLNRVRASLTLYEQALAVYKSAGFAFQMASAQSQVGTCHQLLWLFEGAAPESLEFESAIECYESAATGLAQTPAPFISRRMNARILLELWSKGYLNNVKFRRPRVLFRYLGISRWSRIFRWMRLSKSIGSKGAAFFVWLGYKIKLPLEETLKWLDIAEKLTDQERHDLSALNSKQAILAKQGLRRDENVRVIYDTAVIIHMKAGDAKGLWNWLQKAKARSISDMLGLGFNLPDYLKQRVERDQKAQAMLEEEVKLIQKVNQDASDTQFYRRKELEAHRRAMQGVESLQEILVLREGRAVSHARLRGLRHHIMTKETGRRIFYVDWFTCGDKICALFVSDESDDIGYFDAQMTTIEVAEWKEAHLTSKNTKKKPLDDEDTSPLRAITRLVEPLLNVTKEGDLLVFCPTDVLHGIPMHAAVTSPEESEKPQFLIDRNPILYTSSLTIFEQCVLRAVSSRGKDTGHTEKFLAVYEQADFGLEEERYKIYKTSSKLASQVNAAVAVGSDVTRSAFKTACESDVVHFFGHFDYEAKNIMDQGLILASDNGAIKDPSTQLPEEGSHANVTEDTFSVSDMFSTSIRTSHFTLIACASATQAIQQGDEPLGIVMALLCAGASSVVGTMWPIASGTGRPFLKHFSTNLHAGDDEEESIVDLAVALQKAVKKLKVRGPKAMKEPYHWASFVLHGAWFYRKS